MTTFAMKAGDQLYFLFSEDCPEMEVRLDEQLMKQRFEETVDFWHTVVSEVTIQRPVAGDSQPLRVDAQAHAGS